MAEAQAFTGTKKLSGGGRFPTPRVPRASFSPRQKQGAPASQFTALTQCSLICTPPSHCPWRSWSSGALLTWPGTLVNVQVRGLFPGHSESAPGAGWEDEAQETTVFMSISEWGLMIGPQRFLTWGCLHLRAEAMTH